MKTLVSKDALNRMALCICFLSALAIAQGAEPITITMTADHWQTKENAEFLRQLGFFHGLMRLNSGNAVLKGITFSDGTIEFDVNTIGRGSPGIAFRQQDEGNFELLYLRPDPSCPAFRACIQYAPQTHGVLLWDLFPQYQTRAPLRENGWNHIKMIVSGRRMNVFVNDAPSPTLEVGRLEGDTMKGGLRLQGPGTFANMVITPDAVDGLSPEPARDPLDGDRGLVRNWRPSTFSALPNGKDTMYNELSLSMMNAQSGETSECSVTVVSQLINGAHTRFISGEYAESYRLERAALACYEASSTPADVSARTAILSRLGELSWLRGRIGEAETWLKQALAIHEKDPGAVPTPGYAATLIGLATIDGERRQYVKAEPLVRQALEVCGLLSTPDAISCRRTAMNTLGNLHAGLQDPEGAERVYRNALALENAGEPDVITAALLHNLAVAQQDQGRVGEAEKHYREALSLRCRLLPRGHSDTRKTVESLRLLLQHSGRKQESRQLRLTPRPECSSQEMIHKEP